MSDKAGNCFRVVGKGIIEQIFLARDVLQNDPLFDLEKQSRVYHALHTEANKHSVAMEVPNGKIRTGGRARRVAQKNLRDAQTHFAGNYDGTLTPDLLSETASLVKPSLGEHAFYRSPNGGICYSSDGFVYPRNVSTEMQTFFEKNDKLCNAVGKAVHAHFHIGRIHPFQDGNGRLARLVQNGILDYKGFPPIVIEQFERNKYLDLISAASQSYKIHNGVKPEQARFYNFLALKLFNSLTNAQRKLARKG